MRPKADEAARLGVSATTIAAAARIATVGDIDANVAKLDEGERRIPDPRAPAGGGPHRPVGDQEPAPADRRAAA